MMHTFGPGTFAGFYRTDHDPPLFLAWAFRLSGVLGCS
jgi:hypothetical protein